MVWRHRSTWETDFFLGGWGVLSSDDLRYFWLFTMVTHSCPTPTIRQPTAPPRPHAQLPLASSSLPPSRTAHHLSVNKRQHCHSLYHLYNPRPHTKTHFSTKRYYTLIRRQSSLNRIKTLLNSITSFGQQEKGGYHSLTASMPK